jgi:hypothetical protein
VNPERTVFDVSGVIVGDGEGVHAAVLDAEAGVAAKRGGHVEDGLEFMVRRSRPRWQLLMSWYAPKLL